MGLALAPIGALAIVAAGDSGGLWPDLIAYVLPAALQDTLILLAGVGLLTTVIGTGTAWLVTRYRFPGDRLAAWALLLPLAVPTYIVAYSYLDFLHPVGPAQSALRALLGYDTPREFRLPDIRSMAGCIALLSVVLYPYVYLTTRAVFLMQSATLMEVARTLGCSGAGVFTRVALPLARPAIVVGVSLALLEALNDIGASEFLGVRTLTVSVYNTWITRSNLPGAAQIAMATLVVIFGIVLFERYGRRLRRYANDAQHPRPQLPVRLHGWRAGLALTVTATPIALGFVIPAAHLAFAAAARVQRVGVSPAIVTETINTLTVSIVATLLAVAVSVVVAYAARVDRRWLPALLVRLSSLGYAVPGTVLAIGVLSIVTAIEGAVDNVAQRTMGISTGIFLLGSGAAIVYAYGARFLAIGTGGVDSAFGSIAPSLDEAARTSGEESLGRLRRVHLPLARPAIVAATLLMLVDCMKELPATLLLRPIGFETLATHVYGEAVRGTYEDAAVAALLIVVAGLAPVGVLARIGFAGPLQRSLGGQSDGHK